MINIFPAASKMVLLVPGAVSRNHQVTENKLIVSATSRNMGLVQRAIEIAFTEFRMGFPYPITSEGEKGFVGEVTEYITRYFYNSIKRYHLGSALRASVTVI